MRSPVNCPGPVGVTRRNMLQVGALGALNLALPPVLAAGERRSRGGEGAGLRTRVRLLRPENV
jgi:hypothetical protein